MGIPSYFAFALGCVIGLLIYGPVKRWIVGLRQAIRDRRQQSGSQRKGMLALLVIFATGHPAPWLLLVGLPYGFYRLWNDPLWPMWLWLLAGALLAPVFFTIFDVRRAVRLRQTRESPPAMVEHE